MIWTIRVFSPLSSFHRLLMFHPHSTLRSNLICFTQATSLRKMITFKRLVLLALALFGDMTSAWETLIYDIDIPVNSNWDNQAQVPYSVNECSSITAGTFSRVAYELTLDAVTIRTEFDTPNPDACLLGVPTDQKYEQTITGLTVTVTGDAGSFDYLEQTDGAGSIEFWSNCYGKAMSIL